MASEATSSSRYRGVFLAAVVAAAVATGFYHDVVFYISPAAFAIFLFALFPQQLKKILIVTLVILSLASVAFQHVRRLPTSEQPDGSKIALVTGASSGIGAEMAKELARKGYGLVVVARREGKLKELEEAIRKEGVPKERPIHLVKADLSKSSEAERVHRVVTKDLGVTLSLLVNNAGIGYTEDFINIPHDKIEEVVALNIVGTTRLTRYFAEDMAKQGRGRIAVISSIAGAAPGPHVAVYSATKAYLTSLTLALQHELEPRGVSVTCVVPGATFTEFEKEANAHGAMAFYVPGIAMSAHDVAVEGVAGILQGRSMVVPGLVNKIYMLGTLWMPPKILRFINEMAWS